MKMKMSTVSVENMKESNRVCKICETRFSSCNALRGHMKVHKKKDDDDHNKKPNSPSSITNSSMKETCKLCGREFQSKKALYGHMRKHPKRGWRGVEWVVTGKRGRKPKPKPKPNEIISSDVHIGAHYLMMLSRGDLSRYQTKAQSDEPKSSSSSPAPAPAPAPQSSASAPAVLHLDLNQEPQHPK